LRLKLRAGLFAPVHHHGVDARVHRIQPRQAGVEHFARAQLATRNVLRQGGGVEGGVDEHGLSIGKGIAPQA
jgi:hypothetical protein